ncbi:MAG: alpha/beta fold hydrolase [Puniceicoccales bacterium]|jgi:haloalkane dehalogenase|nr:alpha/beta fold hydrolase [Puniceicoccales bacterium]
MDPILPKFLRGDYPFADRFVRLEGGSAMHYVDEGKGSLVLLLHDIPSWSFHFRQLIQDLSGSFRCVAPDFIGFGLSDKPAGVAYSPRSLADNILAFCTRLNVGRFHLVLHGWGALPGMVAALRWPERVKRIVLLNANCFAGTPPSSDEALCHIPLLGRWLVQGLNLPVRRVAAASHPHPRIRRGYRFPYGGWRDRAPTFRFFSACSTQNAWLKELQQKLYLLSAKKAMAFWGTADRIFGHPTLEKWKSELDFAKVHELAGIGRQVLEGEYEFILPHLRRFLLAGEEARLPTF